MTTPLTRYLTAKGSRINIGLMVAALARFQEAAGAAETIARRDRALRPLIRDFETAVSAWFARQGQRLVKALKPLAGRFDQNAAMRESLSPSDWEYLTSLIFREDGVTMAELADPYLRDALMAGAAGLLSDFTQGAAISFTLDHPDAVFFAQQRAAEMATQINGTTRAGLNLLITQAVTDGWSYDRLAEAITGRFAEFTEGRAHRIAVFEMGNAYEAGNRMAANQLVAAGLEMEKGWLTVGDDRVRPSHRDNQGQGYIPLDDAFSSGHDRPPTDPGCRCATLYRRRK